MVKSDPVKKGERIVIAFRNKREIFYRRDK